MVRIPNLLVEDRDLVVYDCLYICVPEGDDVHCILIEYKRYFSSRADYEENLKFHEIRHYLLQVPEKTKDHSSRQVGTHKKCCEANVSSFSCGKVWLYVHNDWLIKD